MVRGTGIAASGAVLSPRRWHLVLGGILAASLALDLVPLWWDLASANGWAPDEIHPSELNRAARHGFSAWASRYPPFHYYLLSVSFQAFSAAASWVGMVPQDLDDYHRWLFVVGRVISSLMATGTVYVVYRCARCLYPRGAACGAALSVALMPPIVYYAKTMNLEAPYVFWFSISVFFLLRILQRQRLRDYLLLAATTAFAIGSKDQAYGLYLLVPVVLVGSLAAWRKRREPGFRVAALLVDRRLVGGLLLSLLLFALIHRVPFDPVGFSKHLDAMRAVAAPAREFDATLGGNFDLARQSLRNTVFALGAPLSLLSLAGLVLAAARPYRNWRVLALLPLPLSYQLFFIDLVGYSYARFMIPVCVILSLFVAHALREAQRALAALVEPKIERAVLAGLAIAIFGHALLRASSVDLVMIADSRRLAGSWLRETVAPGERALALGRDQLLPAGIDVVPWRRAERYGIGGLRGSDWVVLNRSDLRSRLEFAVFEDAHLPRSNLVPAASLRGDPLVDLPSLDGVRTNLDRLNPEIVVFRARRPWGPEPESLLAAWRSRGPEGRDGASLAREILDGAVPEKLELLPGLVAALGTSAEGRIFAGEPVLLAVRNPGVEPLSPELRLVTQPGSPLVVRVGDGVRDELHDFSGLDTLDLRLPAVAPGAEALFELLLERTVPPGRPPRGRQARLRLPPSAFTVTVGARLECATSRGWTRIGSPSYLVVENPRPEPMPTRVRVEYRGAAERLPLLVRFEGEAGRGEIELRTPGALEMELTPVPAYGAASWVVLTRSAAGHAEGRGVRIVLAPVGP